MAVKAKNGFALSERRWLYQAQQIIVLLGLVPAVMTSMIAPIKGYLAFFNCDGPCMPPRLLEPRLADDAIPFVDLPFEAGIAALPLYTAAALVIGVVGLSMAVAQGSLKAVASLLPLAFFALREPLNQILAGISPIPPLPGEYLYNLACTIVVLSFVWPKRTFIRTVPFGVMVLVLLVMLRVEPHFGFGEFFFFIGSMIVLRTLVHFARDNLAIFQSLGLARTAVMVLRTLMLMIPILVVILLGEWGRSALEGQVLAHFYERRPLCTAPHVMAIAVGARAVRENRREPHTPDPAEPSPDCPVEAPPVDATAKERVAFSQETERAQARAAASRVALAEELLVEDACAAELRRYGTEPRKVERDLCYRGELIFAGRAAEARSLLQDAKDKVDRQGETAGAWAARRAREALPNVRLPKPRRCGVDPLCGLEHLIMTATERAMNRAIGRARNSIARAAGELADDGTELTGEQIDTLTRRVEDDLMRLRLTARAVLSNGFDLAGVVNHLLLAVLVVAFLKSFCFIFARVVFASPDREAAVAFATPDEHFPEGALAIRGRRYTTEEGECLYFGRQAQMEGIAPRIALPQPAACVLPRLSSQLYLMNKADIRLAEQGRVVFKTGDVRQFVEWRLQEGEEVIFRFGDFIGMDGSVTLSTYLSFRIPTLIMGRFLFRVARGPGRLILRTDGRAEISDNGDAALSKPVHRFVAWHRGARFKLDAEQNVFDIYLSGVHLKKRPGDLVVFVAESGDRRRVATGAIRFLKTFVLPV